jgi:hypothetical protein
MTHQDLLDAYVRAELSVIGEFSGNFVQDWRVLIEMVEAYASENGLDTRSLDFTRELIEESEVRDDD